MPHGRDSATRRSIKAFSAIQDFKIFIKNICTNSFTCDSGLLHVGVNTEMNTSFKDYTVLCLHSLLNNHGNKN